MVAGLGFAGNNEILILGGGVGLLGKFLTTHLQAKVTNLEISDEIIKVIIIHILDRQNIFLAR